VIDAGREDGEQVGEERRGLVEVEVERAVVLPGQLDYRRTRTDDLEVGDLDDVRLELLVVPGVGRALDHGQGGVVVLLIVGVEEDERDPEVGLLDDADDLGHVDARVVELEMVHELLGPVLGVEDGELGELGGQRHSERTTTDQTHVRTLEPETGPSRLMSSLK